MVNKPWADLPFPAMQMPPVGKVGKKMFLFCMHADAASLLEKLIKSAPRLILPYVSPIQKALVAKLRSLGHGVEGIAVFLPLGHHHTGKTLSPTQPTHGLNMGALPHGHMGAWGESVFMGSGAWAA